VDDRQPELAREIVRLIESPLAAAGPMERHGNHGVGAFQNRAALLPHAGGEREGERPAAVVLQGVHNRAERSIVFADGAASRDPRPSAPASRTGVCAQADHAP
jgi:hypothetical protein